MAAYNNVFDACMSMACCRDDRLMIAFVYAGRVHCLVLWRRVDVSPVTRVLFCLCPVQK